MPTPGKDEKQDEFISRCIPMVMHEGTAKDTDQAAAICHSMWRDHMKEKKSEPVEPEKMEPQMYIQQDTMERRCLPRAEFRVTGSEHPKIEGYAALFDTWADIGGWFKERIMPGAFAKTIRENDVRALVNHDANYVLGRNKAKTLRLWEDSGGLGYQIDPPDTAWARDLLHSMRRGDVSQSSFGFTVNKQDIDHEENARTLIDVTLFDVSVVTFPAYPQTSAQVRAAFAKYTTQGGTGSIRILMDDFMLPEPKPGQKLDVKEWEEWDRITAKIKGGLALTAEEVRAVTTYIPGLSVPPAQHTETPAEPPAKHSASDTRAGDRSHRLLIQAEVMAPSRNG